MSERDVLDRLRRWKTNLERQAAAWQAVAAVLDELVPGWHMYHAQDNAVQTIRAMFTEKEAMRSRASEQLDINVKQDADLARIRAENAALREALHWCGGSADFAEGGKARDGWLRTVVPLLGDGLLPPGLFQPAAIDENRRLEAALRDETERNESLPQECANTELALATSERFRREDAASHLAEIERLRALAATALRILYARFESGHAPQGGVNGDQEKDDSSGCDR